MERARLDGTTSGATRKAAAAPGSAYFLGQLVQVRIADGASFDQLARVCALDVRTGERTRYVCRPVVDGWGMGAKPWADELPT
eukprot:3767184-Prymnesium_polylepis.1